MMWRMESLSALKMTHLGICLTHLGIKLPPSHGDIERPKLAKVEVANVKDLLKQTIRQTEEAIRRHTS